MVRKNGAPEVFGKRLAEGKAAALEEFSEYFGSYGGMKIAAVSDTDGSYAIPMALMGAEVTVFGVSEDGRRYAVKAAKAAGTKINYETRDFFETEERFFGEFDAAVLKNAVIHYFYDIERFFGIVGLMLKTGGKLVCVDFHPFLKSGAVCFNSRLESVRRQLPEMCEKRFALTDVLRAISVSGFEIIGFTEEEITEGMTVRAAAAVEAVKR
ncbi:MAG: class I SAM-dependent methyltransferase [Ruminococcus sp.]|nr:class I SAM-dependent methyltransferase [Ruminococcus sp.]MCM1380718.1 class I SAM-dependent methyltransferase [Muribaculaceae bacterium]MCM1479780.1 class I SAM-dependent methyltransferase [Muribaculaceae bacterium]